MNKSKQTNYIQNTDEKKKRKKFIILFIIIGFFLLSGTVLGIVLKMQHSFMNTSSTKLDVVIDPIICTNEGENHVYGAQKFVFGEDAPTTYDANIEAQITYGQYIYYLYTIKNEGKTDVEVDLSIVLQQKTNANITYSVDNGTQQEVPSTNILNFVSTPNSQKIIKVFIKIDNINEDAYVKGTLTLYLAERGVDDEQ